MSKEKPAILIVDDVEANIHSLRHILKKIDVDIIEALSGQEALSLSLKHDFFAILMDAQMPEMDGFETASRIFKNPKTSHVPIIFITAINKSDEFIIKGYESGAVDYMTKPINGKILLSKINIFLDLYKQKSHLKILNHKLEEFTQTASHDLRAPLKKIDLYFELLQDDMNKHFTEEHEEMADAISMSISRMDTLIDDLLNYAKVVNEDAPIEPVNLNAITKNALEDMKEEIRDSFAEITVCNLPTIQVNTSHIEQIIHNLLSNSIKYRKRNTSPNIEISCKEFGDEGMRRDSDRGHVKILVKDNGIGFDEKYLNKIFLPFERLVTKGDYAGSGVGLATVKEILDCNNGFITAKSIVGKGSTFIVTLPIS